MSEELNLSEIKKRLISSFVSLTARQVLLRAIGFISLDIILARVLSVEVLGISNIANSIIAFLAFFSDIGLAASLIQKKDQVTQTEINTTFTIQEILVGVVSLGVILLAPWLGSLYHLNSDGVWLIRVLGLAFFLTSLKVIPSVLLERNLQFKPLVTVELIETIIFNVLLIDLAFNGFGLWSFIVAELVRSVVGVVLIYLVNPVSIGLGISRLAASKLLTFGLPYQLNSILALIKDRLVPLVVAGMVGALGIGYITWSQALAFLPLEAMNVIIKITFPAFSRLQSDKHSLERAIETSLFITTLIVYPLIFGLGAVFPTLVTQVVSSKWQPATFSFYLFAFSALWAVVSTTFVNALNAIGFIKSTLKLMVMWTVVTWVLTPILVLQYGYVGVGLTAFIISFTSCIPIFLIKKHLSIKVLEALILPTTASVVMAGIVFILCQVFVFTKLTLVFPILAGGLIYLSLIWLMGKKKILIGLNELRHG